MKNKYEKGIGIGVMLILSIVIIISVHLYNSELSWYSTFNINNEDHTHCQTEGWEMDTLYHPTNPNRFNISLHYYQEIEYYIDTVDVIEEDGIRWYTLDTIQYESIDTTILRYPWGREEIYYFKYKDDE